MSEVREHEQELLQDESSHVALYEIRENEKQVPHKRLRNSFMLLQSDL